MNYLGFGTAAQADVDAAVDYHKGRRRTAFRYAAPPPGRILLGIVCGLLLVRSWAIIPSTLAKDRR